MFRIGLVFFVLIYVKATGHTGLMLAIIAAFVIFSIWEGWRKSSPDRYEENV